MTEAGLDVVWDPVGNIFGRLQGRQPQLPEVWTGSHLDSVPNGGRFDGALGVVAAIEAICHLSAGPRPARTVGVVVFRDEEGWRFGRGCFGSRALCGRLDPQELDAIDENGLSVSEALAALGRVEPPRSGWIPRSGIRAFLETHIEQGPILASVGSPLGVVTGIVGMMGGTATFVGRGGHAGTVPMGRRADALSAGASFMVRLCEMTHAIDGSVATVGQVRVDPGASNVVPSGVVLSLDLRAPSTSGLDALDLLTEDSVVSAARDHGCSGRLELTWREEPVLMAREATDALRRSVRGLGCREVELYSGAGHDAGVLAAAGIPCGILFVRSLGDGVSHSPLETTDPEAVMLGIAALTRALSELAKE
jgi:hydantoinase/carbamoylase family amidase